MMEGVEKEEELPPWVPKGQLTKEGDINPWSNALSKWVGYLSEFDLMVDYIGD